MTEFQLESVRCDSRPKSDGKGGVPLNRAVQRSWTPTSRPTRMEQLEPTQEAEIKAEIKAELKAEQKAAVASTSA